MIVWQAHSVRASLSGLRKVGLTITRRREGTATIYAIDDAGPPLAASNKATAPEVPTAAPSASAADEDRAVGSATPLPAES